MTEADGLDACCRATTETLGPLISAPKLTEKLLKKPPFRFIYDIIMALKAQHGFAEGLFTDQELDSKYFAEKEQKVQFLDKVISLVNEVLGAKLAVRSGKITAGLEVMHSSHPYVIQDYQEYSQ